ncbi:Double-stranded RNA-binding-like domain-containing protein [Artemisia annua]|uniref:Double-stranded RNA-binding-like domain-containing protein n=1 Tax=Artemisia annua TaxID=35608 RepID=A0A2U1MEU9_ARTAN|nr:Double-stranded RNA-binding-like domain-containing protein [Artemisia annua]
MALSMKEKYDKYWDNMDNMNFLLHVALVLDPRNKLYYLKYCLGLIYGEPEESKEEMFESDDEDVSKRGQVVKRVKSTLNELYKRTMATFDCLLKTYGFLTPDLWIETRFSRSPFQEYTDMLAKPTTKAITYVEDAADIAA